MSRLAAVANALYYPTPLELVEPLLKHIKLTGYDRYLGVLLDPTCGEGLFARALVQALNARYPAPKGDQRRWRTFGIELDAARAAEAKTHLDYCLCAPLEQTVIQGQADILFLNPPYDEVAGERIELRFLRLALPALREGGLAIFVLPEHYVGDGKQVKPFAALLRKYGFDHLKVLRFPDPHYAPFKQYVMLGIRGKPGNWQSQYGTFDLTVHGVLGDFTLTPDQEAEFYDRPRRPGAWRYAELPDQVLTAYANNQSQTLTIVKTALAERDGCFTDADLRRLYKFLGEPTDRPATFQPLVPISDLHAAAVVAAGYLDGVAVAGKVLRGATFKRMVTRQGFVDGVKTEISAEISVTQLSILDEETGDLKIINSEDHAAEFDAFIIGNVRVLVDTIKRLFPPVFTDGEFATWQEALAQVKAPRALRGHDNGMFLPQARIAAALLTYWRKVGKVGAIVGEMSTGKTVQSLAAGAVWAAQQRSQKLVIVLPAKEDLAVKWREEALTALRFFGQHGPRVTYAKTVTDLRCAMAKADFGVILMKETTAKLSSGWQMVTVPRRRYHWATHAGWELKAHAESWARAHEIDLREVIQRKRDGRWNILRCETLPACSACGQDLTAVEDFELNPGRQQACPHCGAPLWTRVPRESGKSGTATTFKDWCTAVERLTDANPDGPPQKWRLAADHHWELVTLKKTPRREWLKDMACFCPEGRRGGGSYPLARFLRTHYARRYGLIIDEAHKMKGADTAVGYAANDLLSGCKVGLIMTGTIFNGAASSIFYLLYRSQPWFRQMFDHNDVQRFIDRYGLMQTITRWVPCSKADSASGYRKIEGQPSERPGVAPGMVVHLLKAAAFIKLADLGFPMPSYKESTLFVDLDDELAAVYGPFMEQCRRTAAAAAEDGDYSPRGQYQVARWGILDVPLSPDVVAGHRWPIPPLPKSGLFRKEEAFLRLVGREKQAGRQVLCFVAQIKRRDPTPRLCDLLQQYGMKGVTLYAEEKQRREFIVQELAGGADVIFCSPGILDVGVDLDMFQTAVWYGLEWNALIVAQANRRLWRLTQTQPVEVVYLAYNESKQCEGFDRVATRLAAMQALQGDIRAGLAQLRGERDFLADLQEAVDDSWQGKRLDSTYTMTDLPPLKVFGAPVVPVIEELLWEPVLVAKTGQLGFGW